MRDDFTQQRTTFRCYRSAFRPQRTFDVRAMTVVCPSCNNHRSKRLRTCVCCKRQALPSCRPERCMIMGSLENCPVKIRWDPARHTWTLCKWCLIRKIAELFRAQTPQFCIAGIVSRFCGGPDSAGQTWTPLCRTMSVASSSRAITFFPPPGGNQTRSSDSCDEESSSSQHRSIPCCGRSMTLMARTLQNAGHFISRTTSTTRQIQNAYCMENLPGSG